jgi:hypothetical protein
MAEKVADIRIHIGWHLNNNEGPRKIIKIGVIYDRQRILRSHFA